VTAVTALFSFTRAEICYRTLVQSLEQRCAVTAVTSAAYLPYSCHSVILSLQYCLSIILVLYAIQNTNTVG